MRRARLVLLALGVAAGCVGKPRSAARPDSAGGDVALPVLSADARARRAFIRTAGQPVEFTLTPARLERLRSARERLARVRDQEAALARGLDVREDPPTPSHDVVTPAVARLRRSSATRRAIERAGLSVRDYVLGTFALQQALLAQRARRPELLEGVLRANVGVVERNADRVARITAGSPYARIVVTGPGAEVEELTRDTIPP